MKSNGFEPTYNYYLKDDLFIIRVEVVIAQLNLSLII